MLEANDAKRAIEKWKKAFTSKTGVKIALIWDCMKMDGYDTESRNLWQNALNEMRDQIDSIWLITNSNYIKIGARIISVFTSLTIKVVDSEDQIKW